jgi:hypothetical protein
LESGPTNQGVVGSNPASRAIPIRVWAPRVRCIVHRQDVLADFQRSAAVSTLASKHEPSLLVEGQAVPRDKTSGIAVRIASRFLLVAYASALQHCPGPNTNSVIRDLQREER